MCLIWWNFLLYMRGHKFSNISSLFKLSETYRAELFQSGGFINGSLHLVSKLRVPVAKKMIFNSFFRGHKVFWKIGRPFAHSLHVSYLWSFICLALLGYCHSTWWSSWRVGEEGALVVTGNNYMGGISLCLWWTIWSEWNRQKLFRWRTFSWI